jgi:hypothetical protein
MREQEEIIGLEGRFVLHNAVLRDADAVQTGADRAQSADNNSAFQRADNPGQSCPFRSHR